MSHTITRSSTARWADRGARWLIGATAIATACVALAGTGLGRRVDEAPARLRLAMAAYEARQWPQAYAQLSAAADAGDPAAARIAAMMARQGPLLFGQRFDASTERLRQWDGALRGRSPLTSPGTGARTDGSPPAVQVARAR